ncbi:MAG TPA: hypothetical protein VGB82_19165 [Alphaproteobacteria bacterium]
MAKEDPQPAEAAPAPPSAEEIARRKAEEQKFWEAARARQRQTSRGRGLVIGAGLALGIGVAVAAIFYGRGMLTPAKPPPSAAAAPAAAAPASRSAKAPPAISGVAKAADAATLTVAGQTVRLQGIQGPPASLICRDAKTEYRCGEVARRVLEIFAGAAPVACTPTPGTAQDSAICRNQRGFDIASLQVESGWAIAAGTASVYAAEQAKAQAKEAGLWRGAFARPELWVAVR